MAAQYDVNLEKCALLKCLCGSGTGWDFPPVFSWDWDGKRLKFVMHFGNRR